MNDLVVKKRRPPDNKGNLKPRPYDSRTGFGGCVCTSPSYFQQTSTSCTHNKSEMVAYQGDVHTVGVGIVITLLCVTNIMTNIHLSNAT